MTRNIFTGIFILVLVLLQAVESQFSIETNLNMMYDDNINNNYLRIQDKITSLNGTAGYAWETEESNTQLFYNGSFTYYQSMFARINQFHSMNGEYLYALGNNKEDILRLTSTVGTGLFRDEYVFYDHTLFTAGIDYKQFLSEWIINKIGYSFRSYSFTNSSGFSYAEHSIFGHLAFSLPTKTTLITQIDLGTKLYAEDLVGTSSSGRGRLASIIPSVTQLTGTVRAGQQLSGMTGLSAAVRYQWNLQKQSRYLVSDEGYMISDDELFDDHYGYEGLQTTLSFTHLLTETMRLKASGGIVKKLYSSLAAFDLGGTLISDQRNDTRTFLNLLFQKEFYDLGFTVKTAFDLIDNVSNDPFYDYTNRAVTFEIVFNL